MTDEGLVEEGNCFLCIIIPHLDKIVFTSCKHISTVIREISRSASSSVHRCELSEVETFESSKAIYTDSLILCDHDYLTSILAELEAFDDSSNLNLVFEYD